MRRIESGRRGTVPVAGDLAAPRSRRRLRRTTWLVVLLVVALLGWFAAVATIGGRSNALPKTVASSFVPPDAYRDAAVLTQGKRRSQAMTEYARARGRNLSYAVSLSMYRRMVPPPGFDSQHMDDVRWVREGITPAEYGQPARYRVFSVTKSGVRLHGQDWGELGLVFEPALLRLPDDAHAGQSWSSHGTALGRADDGQLSYHYAATLEAPSAAEAAAHGCLELVSTMRLSRVSDGVAPGTSPWNETDLWCPGRGVVRSSGSMGGTEFSVSTEAGERPAAVSAELLEGRRPAPTRLEDWKRGRLQVVAGDRTFGFESVDVIPSVAPVVTTAGFLAFRAGTTTDVVALWPLKSGKHWLHWWGRPGGRILSITAFGEIIIVTTSERTMMAYDPDGRLLWSVALDDVALAAPVRVSDDTLAVATLHGTVSLRSATDGHALWTHDVGRGVARQLVSDGSLIAAWDNDETVHVLNAGTGNQRWETDFEIGSNMLDVAGGYLVVGNYGNLTGYDARTGTLRWHRSGLDGLDGVQIHGSQLAIEVAEGITMLDLTDGTPMWSVPDARAPRAVGDAWFALTENELLAVDTSGDVLHSWTLSGRAEGRELAVGANRVWVLGETAGGSVLSGEWVGPRG